MKPQRFITFVAACLLLAGCAVEEIHREGGSIAAVMERDETRTFVTDDGTFTWSTGDQVWLQTTDGNVAGTLSSGEGTSSASFSYGAYVGDMTGKAVYPYNSSHSISGRELSFVLPASYDLGSNLSNTNAAMYGVNVGGTIQFNHLAGVMRFVFKNVPVGTDKFQITLDKKISYRRKIYNVVRDTKHDKYECLAYISKKDFDEVCNDRAADIQRFADQGLNKENESNMSDALRAYYWGMMTCLAHPNGKNLMINVDDEEVLAYNYLNDRVVEVLGTFTFSISKDNPGEFNNEGISVIMNVRRLKTKE